MPQNDFDMVLVGGGLQSALIALAAVHRKPGVRLAIVERGPSLGGNHLWCFHEGDVSAQSLEWLRPLVMWQWPGHQVHFPGFSRGLSGAYSAVSSVCLDHVVRSVLDGRPGMVVRTGVEAVSVAPRRVELSGGEVLEAPLVVDARGPGRSMGEGRCGFQKFLGVEFSVEGALPGRPILMDARVPQTDGFRFFYVLPFAPGRIFVEDTYFSNTPDLDVPLLRDGAVKYAEGLGLRVIGVEREETGVLPLPFRGQFPVDAEPGLLIAGYKGGWFHPTTGYSFPAAVRLAEFIALFPPQGPAWNTLLQSQRTQAGYALWLNRLLFGAFAPEDRWHVLERFYRLPEDTIRRFYALDLSFSDRTRILVGRPPRGLSFRHVFREGLFP